MSSPLSLALDEAAAPPAPDLAAARLQAVAKSGHLHPYILSCAFPLCSCPCPAGTGFNAAPGWDAATGLGTFNYGRIKAQIVAMGI